METGYTFMPLMVFKGLESLETSRSGNQLMRDLGLMRLEIVIVDLTMGFLRIICKENVVNYLLFSQLSDQDW